MRIGFVPQAELEDEQVELIQGEGQGVIYEENEPEPIIYAELKLGPWRIQWRLGT